MNRRDFLRSAAIGAAGLAIPGCFRISDHIQYNHNMATGYYTGPSKVIIDLNLRFLLKDPEWGKRLLQRSWPKYRVPRLMKKALKENRIQDDKRILFEEYNLFNMQRYSTGTLEHILSDQPQEKMPWLSIGPSFDHNGGFGSFGNRYLYDALISEGFRVSVYEADTVDHFKYIVKKTAEKENGISRSSLLGHGEPMSTQFGDGFEKAKVKGDSHLTYETDLREINDSFAEDGILILSSCSIGRGKYNIAERLSQALRILVHAPDRISFGIDSLYFDKDKRPVLVRFKDYRKDPVDCKAYKNGVELLPPKTKDFTSCQRTYSTYVRTYHVEL